MREGKRLTLKRQQIAARAREIHVGRAAGVALSAVGVALATVLAALLWLLGALPGLLVRAVAWTAAAVAVGYRDARGPAPSGEGGP